MNEEKVGYIHARALPGIGEWKEWSPENIEKIVKKRKIEKPNPTFTPHTQFTKQWTMPILNKENEQDPIQGESNQVLVDLTNVNNGSPETKSQQVFISGWALKENEKTRQRGPIKRISQQIVDHVIPIFEATHPRVVAIFAFDNSTSHGAFSSNTLIANHMNVKSVGTGLVQLRNFEWFLEPDEGSDVFVQNSIICFFFTSGVILVQPAAQNIAHHAFNSFSWNW
ncbi:unnamed protein product [Rhizophagus irregularis]|nr:unnamed protein product [Rhizophagus irregularis]